MNSCLGDVDVEFPGGIRRGARGAQPSPSGCYAGAGRGRAALRKKKKRWRPPFPRVNLWAINIWSEGSFDEE
jgi:hypothetical protein